MIFYYKKKNIKMKTNSRLTEYYTNFKEITIFPVEQRVLTGVWRCLYTYFYIIIVVQNYISVTVTSNMKLLFNFSV